MLKKKVINFEQDFVFFFFFPSRTGGYLTFALPDGPRVLGNSGNFGHDDLLDWEKTAMAQLSLITGFREPQDVHIKAYNGLSQSCWIMLCCY